MTLDEIDARLLEIEAELAICRAATPGPWWDESGVIHAQRETGCVHPAAAGVNANADFIASSRTGYPKALAGERRLLRALRAAVGEWPAGGAPYIDPAQFYYAFWRAFNAEKLDYEKEITP